VRLCIPEKVLDRNGADVSVVADDTGCDEDLAGIVPAEDVDAVPEETSA
jgi:hypothetical protein